MTNGNNLLLVGTLAVGGGLLVAALAGDRNPRPYQRRKQCTPGIYLQRGRFGRMRVGEGQCVEDRAPRSAKENADCLGGKVDIRLLAVVADRNRRRVLEKKVIDALYPACNRIRR